MNRALKIALGLALAVAVGIALVPQPQKAYSQGSSAYSPFGGANTAVGVFIPVANVQDSVLYDGELVCADTSAVSALNVKRIGVRRFDGTSLMRPRIIGIVAQPTIDKSSKRGTGRVLIWGYHPKAYVGAINVAVNTPIKVGLLNAMFQTADTLEAACGYAISRSSATASTVNTGPRYQYKVFFFGTRAAGATL